jgi:hypothetical protein
MEKLKINFKTELGEFVVVAQETVWRQEVLVESVEEFTVDSNPTPIKFKMILEKKGDEWMPVSGGCEYALTRRAMNSKTEDVVLHFLIPEMEETLKNNEELLSKDYKGRVKARVEELKEEILRHQDFISRSVKEVSSLVSKL